MPPLQELVVAFAAGAVSFASPCMLPLVPGFVAWTAAGAQPGGRRPLPLAAWFVLGFTLVFVALGALTGVAGTALEQSRGTLQVVGGIVITAMGAFMLADRWLPPQLLGRFGLRERRFAVGAPGALAFGAVFGSAWSPCIGPTLGAILTLAAGTGGAGEGAVLLTAFSAGLGVPFLLLASGVAGADRLLPVLRERSGAIRAASGVMLVAFGVLLATGRIAALSSRLSGLGGVEI